MNEYKLVEPKTQASIRSIALDADTLNELKLWQTIQQKVLNNCDFVLSYSGIPTSKHTLPRALEKLAGIAGVHRRVSQAGCLKKCNHNAIIRAMGCQSLVK